MAKPIQLVVAVHGIMTGRTDPTWPEEFERWAAHYFPDARVLTDQYFAAPLPIWNVFVRNRRQAKALAAVVDRWIDDTPAATTVNVHFVGHSNGCDIIRQAAIRLLKKKRRIATIIVVSAPLRRTVKKLGLRPYLEDGRLGRLAAYCADNDKVLARPIDWRFPWTAIGAVLRWPYGNLGRMGFKGGGQWLTDPAAEASGPVVTRMFHAWGHGTFFRTFAQKSFTFSLFCRDFITDRIHQ